MNLIWRLIFIQVFICIIASNIYCQNAGFNQTILLDDKSTRFREIFIENDTLFVIGEIGTDSDGLTGIFILKLDTLGAVTDLKFYRTPFLDDDFLIAGRDPVIINSSGNIIVAGELFRSRDLYLVGFNKNLDSIFYKQYISDYLTALAANIIELDSNYYISGFIQNQNFDLDAFVQKVDYHGNLIWSKSYGIPERIETAHSAIAEDGGLTLMISESYDPSHNLNNTRYWIRLMHIDTSGAIKWDWKEEVTGYEGWSGTLLKYQKDYIYSTNTIGEETNFGPLTGGQIVRRDSAFNIVWRKPLGAPDSQFSGIGDMIFSQDSLLLITGQNVDSSNEFNAARIMKMDLHGGLIWEVRDTGISLPNGQSLNIMEGITTSESGSNYAVGYTYRTANFQEGLILKVSADGCIDTLTTSTSIEEYIRLEEKGMLIYPNPMNLEFSVRLRKDMPGNTFISIYNLQGVEVAREMMSEDHINLDASTWIDGIYLVKLHSNGRILALTKVLKSGSN